MPGVYLSPSASLAATRMAVCGLAGPAVQALPHSVHILSVDLSAELVMQTLVLDDIEALLRLRPSHDALRQCFAVLESDPSYRAVVGMAHDNQQLIALDVWIVDTLGAPKAHATPRGSVLTDGLEVAPEAAQVAHAFVDVSSIQWVPSEALVNRLWPTEYPTSCPAMRMDSVDHPILKLSRPVAPYDATSAPALLAKMTGERFVAFSISSVTGSITPFDASGVSPHHLIQCVHQEAAEVFHVRLRHDVQPHNETEVWYGPRRSFLLASDAGDKAPSAPAMALDTLVAVGNIPSLWPHGDAMRDDMRRHSRLLLLMALRIAHLRAPTATTARCNIYVFHHGAWALAFDSMLHVARHRAHSLTQRPDVDASVPKRAEDVLLRHARELMARMDATADTSLWSTPWLLFVAQTAARQIAEETQRHSETMDRMRAVFAAGERCVHALLPHVLLAESGRRCVGCLTPTCPLHATLGTASVCHVCENAVCAECIDPRTFPAVCRACARRGADWAMEVTILRTELREAEQAHANMLPRLRYLWQYALRLRAERDCVTSALAEADACHASARKRAVETERHKRTRALQDVRRLRVESGATAGALADADAQIAALSAAHAHAADKAERLATALATASASHARAIRRTRIAERLAAALRVRAAEARAVEHALGSLASASASPASSSPPASDAPRGRRRTKEGGRRRAVVVVHAKRTRVRRRTPPKTASTSSALVDEVVDEEPSGALVEAMCDANARLERAQRDLVHTLHDTAEREGEWRRKYEAEARHVRCLQERLRDHDARIAAALSAAEEQLRGMMAHQQAQMHQQQTYAATMTAAAWHANAVGVPMWNWGGS